MDLIEQPQRIAERARQRERERRPNEAEAPVAAASGPAPSARILRLPVESPDRRTTPNVCLRSALFGVVGRGRRRWLRDDPRRCMAVAFPCMAAAFCAPQHARKAVCQAGFRAPGKI
ncbi:hypothetical protein RZS08_40145, partial [Arthrospira platensis SPKY1]|nr:hypothetical protein [Arthrospira platensis SPKY1]